MKVMSERTPLMTVPVRYQTQWVDKLYGNVNTLKQIELYVDGRSDFKLGEIINIVAFFDPEHSKLYFVRKVDSEQAEA